MNISALRKPGLIAAAAAASVLVAVGVPLAIAAPTAAPPSDSQGYVDSTARCTKPDTAVIFGTTETSRVAVCKTAAGEFEYRGVRVSDGARLILAATQTSDGGFVAENDGVTYSVTATSLTVSVGGNVIRTESWTDFNNPQSPASATSGTTKASTSASTSASASPTTSASASPTTSGTASASPSASSSAPQTSAAPASSAVPLPPALPAEVGAGASSGS